MISRFLIALVLLGAMVHAPAPGAVFAQAQTAPSAAPEGAYGLQVTAVRPLLQSSGIELVFSEPSAALLREFSQRASGREVDFVIGGRTITTLKLRDPITGSSVMLTGAFTAEVRSSIDAAAEKGVDIRLHR